MVAPDLEANIKAQLVVNRNIDVIMSCRNGHGSDMIATYSIKNKSCLDCLRLRTEHSAEGVSHGSSRPRSKHQGSTCGKQKHRCVLVTVRMQHVAKTTNFFGDVISSCRNGHGSDTYNRWSAQTHLTYA